MKKAFAVIYIAIVIAFLYLPLLIMVAFSFNSTDSKSVFTGFSLYWYKRLFADAGLMEALRNTLLIAVLSSLTATVLGTAAAIGIHNLPKKARSAVMNISNIPIINPEIVTGVSLMLVFVIVAGLFRAHLGFTTVLLAHITFNIPYVVLNVLPKLRQMDIHLYEAALDLGCTPAAAFRKVVLPEIFPGVLSGLLMAFTFSLDDFIISRFTSGTFQTLPIKIYGMLKKPLPLSVNALSALLFVVVLLVLLTINLKTRHEFKKKLKGVSK